MCVCLWRERERERERESVAEIQVGGAFWFVFYPRAILFAPGSVAIYFACCCKIVYVAKSQRDGE